MALLKIKRLHAAAQLPEYATPGSACFDLRAIINDDLVDAANLYTFSPDSVAIPPGGAFHFSTGLAFEIPPGWVMKIYSRSGHGFKNWVRLKNCTGVIDSDYRQEVLVGLINDGSADFIVRHGDRIAQAMLERVEPVEMIEVYELSETTRNGGFGSTGTA